LKKLYITFAAPSTISNNSIEELKYTDAEYANKGIKVNLEALSNLKKLEFTKVNFAYNDVGEFKIRLPKNIKHLYLESVDPTDDILEQIVANKNLEYLYMSFTKFDKEKYNLTPLTKLTELTDLQLFTNQFTFDQIVIPNIFSLKNLKSLFLRDVENYEILENIDKLKNLESLTLINCNITSIDKIAKLKNLEELYLPGNKISSISDKIGDLKNLNTLSLSSNKIKSLPEILLTLNNLELINVSETELTEIPQFLNNLPNLKVVDFSFCENLHGIVLTNESIERCYYDGISKGNICKPKQLDCFFQDDGDDRYIPLCTNNSDKISTNGKCGPKDGKCPDSKCCSKYGYCGTSDKHCGNGCQSEFGQCTSNAVKISTNVNVVQRMVNVQIVVSTVIVVLATSTVVLVVKVNLVNVLLIM